MKVTQSCAAGTGRSGDSQAWNEFVATYTPLVFGWCRRLGLDDDESKDASQDVLLKLLTALREFHYDPARGRFRAWLKTLTSNLVRDLHRSARSGDVGSGDSRIMHRLSQVEDSGVLEELGDIFVRKYDEELLEIASQRVCQRVEPKNWEAWQLYAIQQQAARSVADQLGIPIAEVYVAKSRITRMLREEIDRMEQGKT